MIKKMFGLILICMVLGAGFLLFGCKHDSIKFYRESAAGNLINKFKTNNTQTKKTPGMIILKDESSNSGGVNFGPGDINFDMPVRFK